jgi:phosphoribosylpyrophosphate synthetase
MSVKSNILSLFEQTKELSVKEVTDKLQVSKQMVHIVMNQLVADNIVEKLGRTPKTVYRFIKERNRLKEPPPDLYISQNDQNFLKQNFLVVTETGDLIEGIEAFDHWCKQRKIPTKKSLSEFIDTKNKYKQYYDKDGAVSGIDKLKNTKGYDKIWLDDIYYLDFYAIERFGKTRLGTLLHYAKQGQNKFLMSIMLQEIADRIKNFIKIHKADAVGFVPPTIRREVQLMKFLQNYLQIPLPVIQIKKLSGIIPVPQKSLSKLDERIKNAENSFAITDQREFKHIILIDDAVGSGSTLNQIAAKIKDKGLAKKVTGLAVVGSFKGFDVVTDV